MVLGTPVVAITILLVAVELLLLHRDIGGVLLQHGILRQLGVDQMVELHGRGLQHGEALLHLRRQFLAQIQRLPLGEAEAGTCHGLSEGVGGASSGFETTLASKFPAKLPENRLARRTERGLAGPILAVARPFQCRQPLDHRRV